MFLVHQAVPLWNTSIRHGHRFISINSIFVHKTSTANTRIFCQYIIGPVPLKSDSIWVKLRHLKIRNEKTLRDESKIPNSLFSIIIENVTMSTRRTSSNSTSLSSKCHFDDVHCRHFISRLDMTSMDIPDSEVRSFDNRN